MKKVLTILCLLVLTTGAANASPKFTPAMHKAPAPYHRVAPKPQPIVYQMPVYVPVNSAYGYSNPSVTFSVGNVDVTLGL